MSKTGHKMVSGTGFSGVQNRGIRLIKTVMAIHVFDDLLSLIFSYFLVYHFRFNRTVFNVLSGKRVFESSYARVYFYKSYLYIFVLAFFLFILYSIFEMYEGHRRIRRTPLLWNTIVSNGIVLALVAVYLFFVKSRWHMRGFIPLILLVNIPVTVIVRKLTNVIISKLRRHFPGICSRTLLLGFNDDAEFIAHQASEGRLKGVFITQRAAAFTSPEMMRENLPKLLTPEVDMVFLIDRELSVDTIMEAVKICSGMNKGMKVLFPRFLTLYNPFSSGDMIDGIPLVHFSPPEFVVNNKKLQRLLLRALALAGVIVSTPFLLIISAMVRLESPGKAFFAQQRYGENGIKFTMFKFRTMYEGAEKKIGELREHNESDGALFKMQNDPRITRIGGFLRRTSIDEIPQIINILRGEMVVVGPRPLPVADLDEYKDSWHFMRQNSVPGITCVWQVSGRSDIGFEDMCLLDAWYWLNSSKTLDIKILVRTIWVVLFRSGAY